MKYLKTHFIMNKRKINVVIGDDGTYLYLSFPFNRGLVDEIKMSTEVRQWMNREKMWKMKKTDRNLFIISYLMGENPYSKYDLPLSIDAKASALPIEWWYHQKKMYAHIIQRMQVIIAGEMRTGKTWPTLQAIIDTNCNDAWWVAPKSALRGLKGELLKRNFPFNIFLLTYARFRRIWTRSLDIVPKFCVFDEAQKLKNPRSKQGQFARELATLQKQKYGDDRYMVLLSGTPAPKDPADWWNTTEIACAGFLREGSHTQLKQTVAEFEEKEAQPGQKYWKLVAYKEHEVANLYKRLDGLVEVFLKKDCLDLPEMVYDTVVLDVSNDYKRASNMLRNSETMAVQLRNKLRQLSDGFTYTKVINKETATEERVTKYFPDCPKDVQLRSDLDEFEDVGRIVVGCGYQASLDKIVAICIEKDWAVLKVDGRGWHALNTTKTVDECLKEMDRSLNQGDIPKLAFCAQVDSASTGLELSASPVIIFYSNSDNGDSRMQFKARAHSTNMDYSRGLEIRDYVHIPVDQLVLDKLLAKETLQSITMGDLDAAMGGLWTVRR